jgi:hypothetical protein
MRLPRDLTEEDRRMIVGALRAQAGLTRVTLAQLRTSELFSPAQQRKQREDLQAIAAENDRLASVLQDKSVTITLRRPE